MAPTPVLIDGCRVAPPILIDPIPCMTATKYGLYSVSDPRPIPEHGANGVEWLPDACDPFLVERWCTQCTAPGDDKIFYGPPDLRPATPFSVYGSFTCSGPGFGPAEAQRRARKNLLDGEQYRVETELSLTLQADASVVDLTPAATPSLLAGLIELESYAGKQMACIPQIHLPGGVALGMPAPALNFGPRHISTALGSEVTAPRGFDTRGPGGAVPGPGEAWLWVTGPVRVWRGPIFEPSAEVAATVNRDNNDVSALSERQMLLGWECGGAAIKVALP